MHRQLRESKGAMRGTSNVYYTLRQLNITPMDTGARTNERESTRVAHATPRKREKWNKWQEKRPLAPIDWSTSTHSVCNVCKWRSKRLSSDFEVIVVRLYSRYFFLLTQNKSIQTHTRTFTYIVVWGRCIQPFLVRQSTKKNVHSIAERWVFISANT